MYDSVSKRLASTYIDDYLEVRVSVPVRSRAVLGWQYGCRQTTCVGPPIMLEGATRRRPSCDTVLCFRRPASPPLTPPMLPATAQEIAWDNLYPSLFLLPPPPPSAPATPQPPPPVVVLQYSCNLGRLSLVGPAPESRLRKVRQRQKQTRMPQPHQLNCSAQRHTIGTSG